MTEEKRRLDCFNDWVLLLDDIDDKISVLVMAFRTLHPGAPEEDFKVAGDRLAGIGRMVSKDWRFVLAKIWVTSANSITGSHLNYIQGAIRYAKDNGKTPVAARRQDPDKYAGGKYAHLVQR